MPSPPFILAVDFDGTVVKHSYPDVGEDVPFAAGWLRRFVEKGAQLVLWTMRGDADTHLPAAIDWFEKKELPLFGVNRHPAQHKWTTSPKVDCSAVIDDRAIGCPLVEDPSGLPPYVDWEIAGPLLLRLIEQHNARVAAAKAARQAAWRAARHNGAA